MNPNHESPPAAPPAFAGAAANDAPNAPAGRIEAMDVLRGFALLGILLMNIEAMAGPMLVAVTGVDPALSGADRWVDALVYLFVQGKFYPLFSLLFGMGFAVMLMRAQDQGRPFFGVYLRRVLALLAIGLAHALLVWAGDILVTYALLAIPLLLFFRGTPQSRLPKWGIALMLFPAMLMLLLAALGLLAQLAPGGAEEMARQLAEQREQITSVIAAEREAYGSGTWAQAVAQRAGMLPMMLMFLVISGWQILGIFLVGAWFVRSGAIQRPAEFPRLYARLRWVALPAGLAMVLLSFSLEPTADMVELTMTGAVAMDLSMIGGVLVALGYLGWLVHALGSPAWGPRLALLAPAGRMALTNYLLQSLVCTWIFYGHGLGYFEQLPRAWQPLFVLAFFVAQVALSHWWLARFRMGPVEWLWRAVTYLRLPPMRA